MFSLSLSLPLPPPPPRSSYHSHGFAPVDGYQWMGNYLVLATFPLTNGRGNCITSTPTCTAAFNNTIIMVPAVIPDLSSGYWGYRWPEILGAHSNGHNAAIAVIKGAMKIINSQETITGAKLTKVIRTVSIICMGMIRINVPAFHINLYRTCVCIHDIVCVMGLFSRPLLIIIFCAALMNW